MMNHPTIAPPAKLGNYVLGNWIEGDGEGTLLYNAIDGTPIARASTSGLDYQAILEYARNTGGPALRKMTFHDRARMLKAMALFLSERKSEYYTLSYLTGATRGDSWIDIDGGIGNLFVYSGKGRRELPDQTFYVDGQPERISKNGTFIGQHIAVPLEGVAIHINAFNFPIWGMLEKIAVNLLAGVPALIKPATLTSYLTERVVRDMIQSGIFPEGSLQLVCGQAGNMLDFVTSQDVVTLTGSATTGFTLKAHPAIIKNSVRFNMEADSLNCCILGPDAAPGTPEFDLFIKDVAREMTVKAGQKCTAIRRTIVPEKYQEEVIAALSTRLKGATLGDPRIDGVRMGPLAGRAQVNDVKNALQKLLAETQVVFGNPNEFDVLGADANTGAFMPSMLLHCSKPLSASAPHCVEAFGPISTIMPYNNVHEAITLAKMGEGSLVGSIVTFDDDFARDVILGSACMHGRMLVNNRACAAENTGHGSPMPHLVHGGPGRAGGGEEMGGIRGVMHYMQRTAVQASPTTITHLTRVYQSGAKQTEELVHPFRKYFEELHIGETLHTHKRTVTETDIVNFANISGDNFYAHMDETSLEGTLFERRVAHGYFILSAAAGLFVDPKKGPVMANYGLEDCRFTKPVYVGSTIGVRLTVKEKIAQDTKTPEDKPRGIVKWWVDVFDETGETVAIATILTLVEKKPVA
jgi:oxepin-CoA hydrolase/3-oxo-5,6-dehydrosuberyl-CoA semialdehyde dehydrogenase